MSTDSHYERIQSTIRKIGAKAYYTQAINARLKDCKKGHWLEGHIAVTVENAEAALRSQGYQCSCSTDRSKWSYRYF